LDLTGVIPEDVEVEEFDLNGRPTIELGEENRALRAAFEIFEKAIDFRC
jgi:CO dehydrogenase maturation factor